MPFGNRMGTVPYRAIVDGVTHEIRDKEWHYGGGVVEIDHPADFVAPLAPGVVVRLDFDRFALDVWRDAAGKPRYRASSGASVGAETHDEERALWSLLTTLGDERAPRACFFCRWSDVEPSTGWGHLGCFVENQAAYTSAATSDEPRRRKWVTSLGCTWVDEWDGCDEFSVRPRGYGYRGRAG